MSIAAHVLIVEDEEKTAQAVALYLRDAGYTVSCAGDGVEGLRLARTTHPDLIVLDLMLPRLSGAQMYESLRREHEIPVIMLTARTTEADRVEGLDLGADDYVTKPFSPRELVSRVRAVLRRTQRSSAGERLSFDGVTVDLATRVTMVDGRTIDLTPTEFRLLEVFLRSPSRVYPRNELISLALGRDFEGYDRTVDAHIKNLRRKLLLGEGLPSPIRTIFGVGYKLEARDVGD